MTDRENAEIDARLQSQQHRLARFAWLYDSPRFAGAGEIVRSYLGLPQEFVLPITFPHGVDTHNVNGAEDLQRIEPIYAAVRPDIATTAERVKPVLRFPHPWLMLPVQDNRIESRGTLFVAPPSGVDNNLALFQAARSTDLPQPWGISLKYRGLDRADSDWWRERGFEPLSAGPANSVDFYPNQRRMISRFDVVALSYPSSMAVFASQLGKQVIAIPDVQIAFVGSEDSLPLYQLPDNSAVKSTWTALLGDDRAKAGAVAFELLGEPFMAGKEELKARLFDAIRAVKDPIYLSTVRSEAMRKLVTKLLEQGFPVHKLLPNPPAAAARKLRHLLNCERHYLFEARLFAHYGIVGDPRDAFRYRRSWSFELGRRPGLGEGPKKARR